MIRAGSLPCCQSTGLCAWHCVRVCNDLQTITMQGLPQPTYRYKCSVSAASSGQSVDACLQNLECWAAALHCALSCCQLTVQLPVTLAADTSLSNTCSNSCSGTMSLIADGQKQPLNCCVTNIAETWSECDLWGPFMQRCFFLVVHDVITLH